MMHIGVGVGDEVVFVKLFRARNVSKQGAIISAKISGGRGRAERIHSPLSGFPWLTRNGQVTSMLHVLYMAHLPATKTTKSPAGTAFNLAHDPIHPVFVCEWNFH